LAKVVTLLGKWPATGLKGKGGGKKDRPPGPPNMLGKKGWSGAKEVRKTP